MKRKGVQDGGETFPGGLSHCLLMQSKWIKNWPKNWEGRKPPSFHNKRQIFAHLFTKGGLRGANRGMRDVWEMPLILTENVGKHDFYWLVDTKSDLCHYFNHGTGIGPFRGDDRCAVVYAVYNPQNISEYKTGGASRTHNLTSISVIQHTESGVQKVSGAADRVELVETPEIHVTVQCQHCTNNGPKSLYPA